MIDDLLQELEEIGAIGKSTGKLEVGHVDIQIDEQEPELDDFAGHVSNFPEDYLDEDEDFEYSSDSFEKVDYSQIADLVISEIEKVQESLARMQDAFSLFKASLKQDVTEEQIVSMAQEHANSNVTEDFMYSTGVPNRSGDIRIKIPPSVPLPSDD